MSIKSQAIIRYLTIDKCLRDHSRRWTLDDLINACEDQLRLNGTTEVKVGKRTIQLDIENMRSPEKGYGAPIVVLNRKYYTYSDPGFSITRATLSVQDQNRLNEVIVQLKYLNRYKQFNDLEKLVLKLQDIVTSEIMHSSSVIDIEKNFTVKGNEFLQPLYESIINKEVLTVWYQSFKAKRAAKIVFIPYLLKEFRNRWYVIGSKVQGKALLNLALDRIEDIEVETGEPWFMLEGFDPGELFNNAIGVTTIGQKPVNVHLLLNKEIAPYILSKPLHHTQQIINEGEEGVEIVIRVIHNLELEREILGYGEQVKVLAPESLKQRIKGRLNLISKLYGLP